MYKEPDSSIIDGQIKSNIPFRVCGHFADPQPSIIVLGDSRAVQLPNISGRFIADNQEIQAYYFKAEHLANFRSKNVNLEQSNPSKAVQAQPPETEKQENGQQVVELKIKKSTMNNGKNLDLDFSEIDL